MRVSHWSPFIRLVCIVLLALASCPFTAPFKLADLATPLDSGPAKAVAMLHAKGAVDDLKATPAAAPVLFAPGRAIPIRSTLHVLALPPARPLQVPLRI